MVMKSSRSSKQKQNAYVQAIDVTCVISESNVHTTQFVRYRE